MLRETPSHTTHRTPLRGTSSATSRLPAREPLNPVGPYDAEGSPSRAPTNHDTQNMGVRIKVCLSNSLEQPLLRIKGDQKRSIKSRFEAANGNRDRAGEETQRSSR